MVVSLCNAQVSSSETRMTEFISPRFIRAGAGRGGGGGPLEFYFPRKCLTEKSALSYQIFASLLSLSQLGRGGGGIYTEQCHSHPIWFSPQEGESVPLAPSEERQPLPPGRITPRLHGQGASASITLPMSRQPACLTTGLNEPSNSCLQG